MFYQILDKKLKRKHFKYFKRTFSEEIQPINNIFNIILLDICNYLFKTQGRILQKKILQKLSLKFSHFHFFKAFIPFW